MFKVFFSRLVFIALLLAQNHLKASCFEYKLKTTSKLLNGTKQTSQQDLTQKALEQSKIETDLETIFFKNIYFIINNKINLNTYSTEEIIYIFSILSRIKTSENNYRFSNALIVQDKRSILNFIEIYKALFVNNLKRIKKNRPDIKNLISKKQGDKFNDLESLIYIYELYNIIQRNILNRDNINSFIDKVGRDLEQLMKENIFIGLKDENRQRALVGKEKTNEAFSAIRIYKSHLSPFKSLFEDHLKTNNYIFNIEFVGEKIILTDVEHNGTSYTLSTASAYKTIKQLNKENPFFKNIINHTIEFVENGDLVISSIKRKLQVKDKTLYLELAFDVENINDEKIISTGILNFYTSGPEKNENMIVLAYPSSKNIKKLIDNLNPLFIKIKKIYKRPTEKLSTKDKEALTDASITFSYYLSKFVPYYRGSSGVARILSAILIEKAQGSLPDLQNILFDLDAFTNNFESYKNNFNKYPFLIKKRQTSGN